MDQDRRTFLKTSTLAAAMASLPVATDAVAQGAPQEDDVTLVLVKRETHG